MTFWKSWEDFRKESTVLTLKAAQLRKLREERDYWFMRARGDTRSLRATITRADKADKEYQEALKQIQLNQNKRSNRITNIS